MKYRTENQIKMELGLNAWRNLLQGKVIRFAHMMQDMDVIVMMKLSGDLPQLRDFARLTLQRLDAASVGGNSSSSQDASQHQTAHTWQQSSAFMRKMISLDYDENTDKDQSKDKLRLLESIVSQLKGCQDLLSFDEQFIRVHAKRNQDSLRHFIIFMLVYTGGCFYPEEQESV